MKKNIDNNRSNYYFLMISLYLFLIIFFVLLTNKFSNQQTASYSSIAKESIQKKFVKKPEKNLDKRLIENFSLEELKKYYFGLIKDYLDKSSDYQINSNSNDKEIINFSVSNENFFNKQPISIILDNKFLLDLLGQIISKKTKLNLKLKILINCDKFSDHSVSQLVELSNYMKKLNIADKLFIGYMENSSEQINFSIYS